MSETEERIRKEASRDADCQHHKEITGDLKDALFGHDGVIAKLNEVKGTVSTTNKVGLAIIAALIALILQTTFGKDDGSRGGDGDAGTQQAESKTLEKEAIARTKGTP